MDVCVVFPPSVYYNLQGQNFLPDTSNIIVNQDISLIYETKQSQIINSAI